MIYYNDNDSFACEWLRCLIRKGHLPDGPVDSRSIVEVVPSDLGSFRQCHFFAGIGGWALALELARWPSEREIWTASLPCQPLSVAGLRQGAFDGRHLWPAFHRLVAICRPPVIVGEQVAGKDGCEWFAGVRVDLEELGYACGAAVMPACAVGAPHRRERLYWGAIRMGDADCGDEGSFGGIPQREDIVSGGGGGGVADAGLPECAGWFDRADARQAGIEHGAQSESASCGVQGGVADADREGWPIGVRIAGNDGATQREAAGQAAQQAGHWDGAEWRVGADGKARRVKFGIRLLADGFPNRVGLLRGFGNAVVPQVAAEFVRALL